MLIRFALMALFCLASLEAEIIETKHIEDVLLFIDEETWFLVDLDNCMFEGAQALGHANWFYDELEQRMQKGVVAFRMLTESMDKFRNEGLSAEEWKKLGV